MGNPEINYEQLPRNSILCVDIKSFFASVEAVDRGLDPLQVHLAVVGDKEREGSVILAASPPLKKEYSIGTGNRLYEVPRVPEIMIVDARMELYLGISMEITRLFNNFVPLDAIHVYSIDESWLKLDGTERLFGKKMEVAEMIRDLIREKFGLYCSMGVGPNMFLAKVAMDIEGKKKGLVEWTYEDVPTKLWPVEIGECWGIGRRLKRAFNKIGVTTVGDLAVLPLDYLERKYGIMGSQLYYHAHGVDLSRVEGHYDEWPQSLGRGITLFSDYNNLEEIKTVVFELSDEVARRCRLRGLVGKTVSLGVGYSRQELAGGFHAQRSLNTYTNLTGEVYETCLGILEENYGNEAVRKVSVSLGNFSGAKVRQLNLFDDEQLKEMSINQTRDYIQEKYGFRALFYGRSLKEGSILERIRTTIGGHKT